MEGVQAECQTLSFPGRKSVPASLHPEKEGFWQSGWKGIGDSSQLPLESTHTVLLRIVLIGVLWGTDGVMRAERSPPPHPCGDPRPAPLSPWSSSPGAPKPSAKKLRVPELFARSWHTVGICL